MDVETPAKILQHKHVIIRADVLKPPQDVTHTTNWMRTLVTDLGMEILQGPYVTYHEQKGNRGLTGICTITTSHVAIHVWDECNPGLLELDVYTCSTLNVQVVLDAIQEFGPTKVFYKLIDREHGLTELDSREIG